MAGIRGIKNPMPATPKAGPSGVFKQSGSGPSFENTDVLSASMKSDRKGPTSGRNSGTAAGKSHYTNGGLKRGTAP
tara:strand:+ start:5881 stop:6108 length:228 start_codon:yes stop_codon:yes gene_type:complete